jgi:hypothetical protein
MLALRKQLSKKSSKNIEEEPENIEGIIEAKPKNIQGIFP